MTTEPDTSPIKYNHTGSVVGIPVREIHGEAIDPAFDPQLFQPFTQADKARKTDGGTLRCRFYHNKNNMEIVLSAV